MSHPAVPLPRVETKPAPVAGTWPARAVQLLDRTWAVYAALGLILLVAAGFRFYGLEWDSGRHLHPDERFLSTVTNDLRWPESLHGYFDPATSSLSPYALPKMGLFVYGTLPVYMVKAAAVLLNQNNYDQITLLGRALSGLCDLGAILFLFLIGRRLLGSRVGLLAAGLLALSVLNIQLSHFYAVDTFATLFLTATLFFLLRATANGRWVDYALTGLCLGLGLASKLSVMTLLAPLMVGMGLDLRRRMQQGTLSGALEQTLVRFVTVLAVAALVFRVLQPIAFDGPSFWDWSLNPRWVKDVLDQERTVSGDADLPWMQQWTDRSMLFPLYNILVWGLGLPLGLASVAGFALAAVEFVRRRTTTLLLPLVYVSVTFVYHAANFVKFMRYFLPLYPFLALFAAYLLVRLWRRATIQDSAARPSAMRNRASELLARVRLTRGTALGAAAVVIGGTLLYALAFSSIHTRTNTRIAASRWMFQNLPAGTTLANEHWDDWLPVGGVDGKSAYGDNGMFKSVVMANYEDDTPAKLDTTVDNLSHADYVVLSSNRLYDSIPRLPARYPMMTRYYALLRSGQLGFERVAEFAEYPTLFGIALNDQLAEESFSVYDHPRVQIFKKTGAFDAARVKEQLGRDIAWGQVVRLTPRQASAAPGGLQLAPDARALYEQTATWSSAEVSETSWGSGAPVLAWALALAALGLVALPLTLTACANLADRGYGLSRAVGLLVVAWGAWWIASARLAPFTWWTIGVVMLAVAALSAWVAARRRTELKAFLRARWRLVALEEALFWLCFAAWLAVRWANPDLWHPGLGGEKPMDLAYLTAIVKTPYFPSYDPWFAGGFINYYYFGFVLVATVIHLTGIVPYIAYNLAVPTFFALTAVGSFTVAFNLAQGWTGRSERGATGVGRGALVAGLCGALFVTVLGNLGQVQLLWNGIRDLSTIKTQGGGTVWLAVTRVLAQLADGALRLAGGQSLGFRTEWWYWNATRVIPAAKGEAGPINELPFFTFLYADLHAHMMALPYTLVALALAVNVIRDRARAAGGGQTGWHWRDTRELLLLGLLALTTGALWPMNTWDFPTYTLLAAAALGLRELARRGKLDRAGLWAAAWRTVLVVGVGRLAFWPFHANFASNYFGAELWNGSRTPLWAYLIIHGFFLFVLSSYLLGELLRGQGHNGVARALKLNLRYWRRWGRMRRLSKTLIRPEPGFELAVSAAQLFALASGAVFLLQPVVGLALGLAALTALLLFSARPAPRRQFVLCLIGLGLVLTALVEVVVLKGDVSRMNTVFKFYFQVWVMWAVAAAVALVPLATWLRRAGQPVRAAPPEPAEGEPWTPEAQVALERWRGPGRLWWGSAWWGAVSLLIAGCLLYPLTALPVRVGDRFKNSVTRTLDGSAYMRTSTYTDQGQEMALEPDRAATEWLRQNVKGMPVIVEANTPLYRWGARVSIYTGLPTIVGWDWHQKQQRAVLPGKAIEQRVADVKTIYTGTDTAETMRLLAQYGAQYVYVGPLERVYYAGTGLDKFDALVGRLWNAVYHSDAVTIYKVQ